MIRLAPAMACCGAACALALAGCVADHNAPQRSALWVTRESGDSGRKEKASPKLQLAYAQMQEQMGNAKEARSSYETVLGADPRNADAVLGLARLDQLAGRTEKAEKGFKRALQLRPKDAGTLDAVGQFYASQQNWAEAIPHLQDAAAADPEKREYRYHLGLAIARSGNPEQALPHLAKTVGVAEAHYNVGYVMYEKGDLVAAEKHFLTASLKNPNLAVAHQMLDEIRNSQGQPKVLPASAAESPRLERSLPFPANEAGSQHPPRHADHRFAPGAARRAETAGYGEAQPEQVAGGGRNTPRQRPPQSTRTSRMSEDRAARGTESSFADEADGRGPTVPFGATEPTREFGGAEGANLPAAPERRAASRADAGRTADAASPADAEAARRAQFEQWQNQMRR